jgi:SPOR domain
MPESPYPGPPPPHPEPASGPVVDSPPPEPSTCSVCGAELDPGQTYCLECGSPTPLAPRLRRGTGGLAAVALGLAILGAGAGALAYVASQDDGTPGTEMVSRPSVPSIITVPTTTTPTTLTDSSLPGDTISTTGTLPADTTFTTPTTDTTSQLPIDTMPDSGLITETGPAGGQTTSEFPTDGGTVDPGTGGSGTDDWPAGTSGWTAIVSSVRNEADARASASTLASQGQPSGVLWSTDHPPLNPGYWVVFSGTFSTKSEALAQARTLVAQWPGAYPRQVDS